MGYYPTDHKISIHWRMVDEFTVKQAALLIVGCDPASEYGGCEGWKPHERPDGYEAVKQALSAALRNSTITGVNLMEDERDWNGNVCGDIPNTTNPDTSTVERGSITAWLLGRGVKNEFFTPDTGPDVPGYLDPNNPRYAPKLAAAVCAWLAVEDALPKKSEKQSLEIWLRAHAGQFGLVDEDGNPIKQAMEECSAVSNWKLGGPPKTPG